MAKQKHKPRRKSGIMSRSDIPLAVRLRMEQEAKINANRETAARVVLYSYSIAMHELEHIGYKRIIGFARHYKKLEDEFYEDPEVGMEHVKERMASHGMEISGEWFRAPDMGYTVRQQEVADNTMQASQVACIVAAVAMNDEFGFGAERQMRIRTRVEELSKEYSEKGMKPLLKKMAKIGFHIQGDRAIHFTDEEGNIVTAKRALEAMK